MCDLDHGGIPGLFGFKARRARSARIDRQETSGSAEPEERGPSRVRAAWRATRRYRSWIVTVLAAVLLFVALVLPDRIPQLTAGAFLRLPVEALVAGAIVVMVPRRAGTVLALVVGALLGVLTILKFFDMGFYEVLSRPFDPVGDWPFLGYGLDFVSREAGTAGAVAVVSGAVLLALAVLALVALAARRLVRLAAAHRVTAGRTVTALGVVWVLCAVTGAHIAGGPVASTNAAAMAYNRAAAVPAAIHDLSVFRAEAARDAFGDTPGDQMLTALHGRDMMVAFVESYGRTAVDDPGVGAVLDKGSAQLAASGFGALSGWLISPTAGGGSWLAQSTLLSGLWIDTEQRYRELVTSKRLSLNAAFHEAGWRTVGVMPAITSTWPEGDYYGYDKLYMSKNDGYQGQTFNFSSMPDQYTLSAFQHDELDPTGRAPVMGELALLSSHTPWAPLPTSFDWDQIGDGRIFKSVDVAHDQPDEVWKDGTRIRAQYMQSVEYSVSTIVSYLEKYGTGNLVMVFLGDHEPASVIKGADADHLVPITIVAKNPAVLARVAGWNWQPGIKPAADGPVWRMDTFRDRFLTAFGSRPES
jgi:hypothetical protein